MLKILEAEDGSNANNSCEICAAIYLWPSLAIPINRFLHSFAQMKRPLRSLFSILLLTVLAVTLSFRVVVNGGFFFSSVELGNKIVVREHLPLFNSTLLKYERSKQEIGSVELGNKIVVREHLSLVNSTLLKYAAIDVGEERSKQEIEQLLEGNFNSPGRHRTFASWRKFHRDKRLRSSSSSSGIPLSLRSPLFYRNWLDFRRNLNDWARKKRFQADIMNDLVRLVKHVIDNHNGLMGSDKKYESCAVVGNSGILLNSKYGELIDSHEMVMRLNNAGIDGFQRNVGSKTTLSFVNSNILHLCARREGCSCHPYGRNVPMIMYICQPIHFLDYTTCNASHKAPLLVTDPRFDMLCSRIVKYYSLKQFVEEKGRPLEEWGTSHEGSLFHYSSGMQAVMLALGICDEVSIFGFGKSASAKHHYHTNQKAELHLHDYEAEYAFYRDLVENQRAIPFISDKFKIPAVVMYH